MNALMTDIEQALHFLKAGQLVAIPTETVYGLGADADNAQAVERVYAAKNRPTYNPLIIHIAKAEAMRNWAINIPDRAWSLAKACWPGPLTLILERHPRVSKMITAQQETVALRIPHHPLTLALLNQFQGGIVAPSANPYGYLSPTTAEHVRKVLGHKVDYVLDGGPCSIGIESTIVYLLEDQPIILREGFFSATALSKILNEPVFSKRAVSKAIPKNLQTPGSDHSHYAPTKPLYLLDQRALKEKIIAFTQQGKHYGVLSYTYSEKGIGQDPSVWIQMPLDPTHYAQQLYDCLYRLDNSTIEAIFVEELPHTEAWLAIQDRLERAARPLT